MTVFVLKNMPNINTFFKEQCLDFPIIYSRVYTVLGKFKSVKVNEMNG